MAESWKLLLMRHAKSDWSDGTLADHDRGLAPRGVEAARRVGRWLTDAGHAPRLVVSSTAVRARTTAELAARAGDWGCPLELEADFYSAGTESLLERLRQAPDTVPVLMAVGHEPTWSRAVAALIGGGAVRMPTAAVACVRLSGSWATIAPATAELAWLVTPKILPG